MPSSSPVIGVTADLFERTPGRWSVAVASAYCERIAQAGGLPIVLPPDAARAEHHASLCGGFVFTGGADPDLRQWGIENHREARLMHASRQAHDVSLLGILRTKYPDKPVLGICLGMQMMCLDGGGTLHQHLPDLIETAEQHREAEHGLRLSAAAQSGCPRWLREGGLCASNHHQGVLNPGPNLEVLAESSDGVIEAVRDPGRCFYVGVQWHPERTSDPHLGMAIFEDFVAAARP